MRNLTICIFDEDWEDIDRLARKAGKPTSAFARNILLEYLIESGTVPKPENDDWKKSRRRYANT